MMPFPFTLIYTLCWRTWQRSSFNSLERHTLEEWGQQQRRPPISAKASKWQQGLPSLPHEWQQGSPWLLGKSRAPVWSFLSEPTVPPSFSQWCRSNSQEAPQYSIPIAEMYLLYWKSGLGLLHRSPAAHTIFCSSDVDRGPQISDTAGNAWLRWIGSLPLSELFFYALCKLWQTDQLHLGHLFKLFFKPWEIESHLKKLKLRFWHNYVTAGAYRAYALIQHCLSPRQNLTAGHTVTMIACKEPVRPLTHVQKRAFAFLKMWS